MDKVNVMTGGLKGWGGMLAGLLGGTARTPGYRKPIRGSEAHYIHYSNGGHTCHHENRRSEYRRQRRSGEISARQQRIQRKTASQVRTTAIH